ncbi:hypothetical protein D3C71_1685600 [compost metagenome]
MAVDPARQARQTRVVGVIHQIRRHEGDLGPVGIALILVLAAEQVVVNAEIDLWRVLAHRIGPALGGGVGSRRGQGQDTGECGR